MLEVDKILQLKEEYVLHNIDIGKGKFWLFNIENGDSYKLNRTTYNILSLIDGKRNIGEIINHLTENYPSKEPKLLLKDIEELIRKMQKEKILEERI